MQRLWLTPALLVDYAPMVLYLFPPSCLQEAMALEDEAGGGSDELGSDPDDLDDYINSLKEEDEA